MCRQSAVCGIALLASFAPALQAQPTTEWRDPSPHDIRFVTTDEGIRVEVLDWGGSGRPVILLAGGGNTAHVFDEFAPKLTTNLHVYGVTRRGFGSSTFVALDGGADRLGKDVLAVIDELRLDRPLLVGHSIGGVELSAVASSHADRIAGLVYLEAAYPYAFDNGKGATLDELLTLSGRQPQPPTADSAALASFSALQRWEEQQYGFRMPEAEFRQTWEATADGRPAKPRDFPGSSVFMALFTTPTRYAAIPAQALIVFASPHVPEPWVTTGEEGAVRSATDLYREFDAVADKQAVALEAGVPTARVVKLRALHYVFLSNEQEVLREMRAFAARLP